MTELVRAAKPPPLPTLEELALAFARANKHGDPVAYAARVLEAHETKTYPGELVEADELPPAAE